MIHQKEDESKVERLRLEALDKDGAQTQHEPEVIGVEDRAREGLAEADL